MLVILGGSSPWTVDLIEHLQAPEAMLVGQNAAALTALRRFLRTRSSTTIHVSTRPEVALEKASVILCQARIGGWPGRREDECGPPRWGGYGDETLGLGGIRGALRACQALAAWARVARHAPVVMLSNPTDLLTRWWRYHSEGEAISVCEVPTELLTELPSGTRYLGVNHLGWALTPAGHRVPTRWLPLADDLERAVAHQDAAPRHRADWLAALSCALRRAIAAGDHSRFDALLRHRPPHWYETVVVPVLQALMQERSFAGVVGLPNAGRLPGLPRELVVESAGSLDGPDRRAVPHELIGEVAQLAQARDRGWELLMDPTTDSLCAYIDADPFSSVSMCSPSLLSWVVNGR